MSPFELRPPEESELTTLTQAAKKTEWQKMNWLEKTGWFVGLGLFLFSLGDGRVAAVLQVLSITAAYIGYTIGGILKLRHAVHFWWSCLGALSFHAAVFPAYVKLVLWLKSIPHLNGRAYATALVVPVFIEVMAVLSVIKRIAVRQQRKRIPLPAGNDTDPWGLFQ